MQDQEDELYHLVDIELAIDLAEITGVIGKTSKIAITINGAIPNAEQAQGWRQVVLA